MSSFKLLKPEFMSIETKMIFNFVICHLGLAYQYQSSLKIEVIFNQCKQNSLIIVLCIITPDFSQVENVIIFSRGPLIF